MDEAVNGTPAADCGVPLRVTPAGEDDIVVFPGGALPALGGGPFLISADALAAALSVHAALLPAVSTASTETSFAVVAVTGKVAGSIIALKLVLGLVTCCSIISWEGLGDFLFFLFFFREGVLVERILTGARSHSSGQLGKQTLLRKRWQGRRLDP